MYHGWTLVTQHAKAGREDESMKETASDEQHTVCQVMNQVFYNYILHCFSQ